MKKSSILIALIFLLGVQTACVAIAPTKMKTPTPTKAHIPTPMPGIGSTMTGKMGGILVYIPAGEFIMGSDMYPEEQPIHLVYLDAFWIDQTEVTNAMYAKCVSDSVCEEPIDASSNTRSSYYGNPEFDKYPVVYVEWDMAKTYCEWAGLKLPTEAQWEKAARGTDGRTYPWGNDAPNKDLLNYDSNIGNTTEVGSYESGKSIYEVYDMAGNVWEWVNDYYQEDYYATLGDNATNPQGPLSSDGQRLLRGGGFFNKDEGVRSTLRYESHPARPDYDFGFRCSRSP